MLQFTTPEQTAKLIELGFEKPKGWCAEGISSHLHMYKSREDDEGFNYSIGELIELLPEIMDDSVGWSFDRSLIGSVVCYSRDNREAFADLYYSGRSVELIDNLFYMIVKLKDEGVI